MSARNSAGAICIALALAGCAVGPDFVSPAASPDRHYTSGADPTHTTAADGVTQSFASGAAVAANWWQLFASKDVNAIVADALTANPTIDAAEASLRQSDYDLRAGYGIFFPSIEADAGAERQKYTGLKVDQTTSPLIFNLFTLSASVSYAVDVFGGERRTVEGLAAAEDAQRDALLAAELTITSNVVNTAIAKAAYEAELDATREIVAVERQQVTIAQVKADAGTAPYANVLSIESQLQSFEATIPTLEQKITEADDLLATLAGRTPAEFAVPEIRFETLTLPASLPVSLPSSLVRQRPDILAAEANLHQASAGVGVATAALLPSLTLNAGYGANNTNTGELFANNANFWSVGAGVTAPLFQGGTLWYRRKAAIAAFDQAGASYRQTVLSAFEQVADTLRALEHDAQGLDAENRAVDTTTAALHLVQANYEAGLADYTSVLIADGQFYQAKIADLEARAQRYQDTVALFVALGGGWWNASVTASDR